MGSKWKQIRDHYRELLRLAKRTQNRTQTQVAAAGGTTQSAISKLIHNNNLGPSVEEFVNAVEGLGIPVSEFFRRLEEANHATRGHDVDVAFFLSEDETDLRALARIFQRMVDRRIRVAHERKANRPKGRKRSG